MAAPHVTGVIALMLQANPNLSQDQIRDCLTRTNRNDAFTGATPNTTWGAGKIDAKAAFDCASTPPTLKFRDERTPTLKFRDDIRGTFKFRDDLATLPTIDLLKLPALDKQPAGEVIKQPGSDSGNPLVEPARPTEAAPFVLATPHHSMAWTQSYPKAFAAMLSEYESRIVEHEKALAEIDALFQKGQLTTGQVQQADALYQEYMALLAEYQSLTQRGKTQ